MAGILAAMLIVMTVCKVLIPGKPETTFTTTYVEPGDQVEQPQETRNQVEESKTPPPPAPPIAPVIVAVADNTLQSFTMEMDPSLVTEGSGSDPTGSLGGTGLGGGMGGSKKGGMGGKEMIDSSFLGTLWDLKRTKEGKDSQYNTKNTYANQEVLALESRFYNKSWDIINFTSYYRAKQKLYATCFYMPNCEDIEACHAYDPDGKLGLAKSRWVALYRAKVRAPASGRFRFYGMADSVMGVRFNGQNVLACGLHNLVTSDFGAWTLDMNPQAANGRELIAYPSCDAWNEKMGGFAPGEVFTVKKGEWYEMQVLISEIGGAGFGFCLLIEAMDEPEFQKKTKEGLPLLMLFRTAASEPTAASAYEAMDPKNVFDNELDKTDMPYDVDSYVWEAKPVGPDEKMK